MRFKQASLIALLIAANLTASATIVFQTVITGKIVEKETGQPVPNCWLWVHSYSYNFSTGQEMQTSSARYECTSNGEFAITNLASRCEIELADSNKYQEQLISGPLGIGTTDWGTIEVSKRPFYLENCRQVDDVVSATVINMTGRKAYMRFWLTGQLTRLDDSEYLGCSSAVPLKLKQGKKKYKDYATYQLVPGENDIELRVKDYGPDLSVSSIMISGGLSYFEPKLPSVPVYSIQLIPPVVFTNFPIVVTNLPPILSTNLSPVIVPTPFPTNPPAIIPWPPAWPPYTTF